MAKSNRSKIIVLVCQVCGKRNYHEYKLKNDRDKREKKKFCSNCNEHTKHKEVKLK